MLIKGLIVSAALIALAPDALAGEQPSVFRRASCTVVRFYVAKYSAAAAETWAQSKGATEAEIDAARRCLGNAPVTAQAKVQPTVAAGWAGQ